MVVFLGVFQIAIPYIFFTNGIKRVPALDASLISMAEPILNPLWVMLFVGETPSLNAVVGGAIIVVAVGFQNARHARNRNLKESVARVSE
jgi:drug/metabolite transporter (DMT)-like permease